MNTPASEHPFAHYVRILGKGKTGTRSLSLEEAQDAFGMILRGDVKDLQLGAFLMLLRVKEESPEEIAGFVKACRLAMVPPPTDLSADLDWSSYAGKKHQHPWFILSQLLLASAGYRILVHGSAGHTAGRLYTQQAMHELGLPVASHWQEAANALNSLGLCYLPLGYLLRPLEALMQLKPLLGLRSPVNTLTRLLNPLDASASIQSIFHPAYASIHQQADRHLGQPSALVFKGDSGEIELKPQADTRLYYLNADHSDEVLVQRTLPTRVPRVEAPSTEPLKRLWRDDAEDEYGLAATLSTSAAALRLLEPELDFQVALARCHTLWQGRNRELLD